MWPFDQLRRRNEQSKASVESHMLTPGGWAPRGDLSLTGSEAIFGAVTMLANTVASMHLKLYKGMEEATGHPLHRLLCYQPSPRMTPYTFWQAMETCRDTMGNCYALKVPGPGGGVEALDVLDPQRVQLSVDQETGDLWYILRPQDGGEMYVSSRNMIHCRHVSASGNLGVSPVDVLRDSLEYDGQIKQISVRQLSGVNGAVILDFPSDLSRARRDAIVDEFKAQYRRSNNSLLVLSGGARATNIERSAVDPRVMDVDRITANKVARVYNMPPVLLGDYASSSYASQEQQQLEFLERTIHPISRMYEDELTAKLLSYREVQEGYRFAFDMDDLLVADGMTRATMEQLYVRNGVRTPNEARLRMGYAPRPGGNALLVSRDLVPLDSLGAQKEDAPR